MEDLSYFFDPTKRGLIYSKPGNRDQARSREELASDNSATLEEGVSVKRPMCPSRKMGLIYD